MIVPIIVGAVVGALYFSWFAYWHWPKSICMCGHEFKHHYIDHEIRDMFDVIANAEGSDRKYPVEGGCYNCNCAGFYPGWMK